MSFVAIWDTCTRPQYYQDLHNALSLPSGALIRYDYKRKYFDNKTLRMIQDLIDGQRKYIECVIFYGEIEAYTKSTEPPAGSMVQQMLPYRLGRIVASSYGRGAAADRDTINYDIELGDYPNLDSFIARWSDNFSDMVEDRTPFKVWHTHLTDRSLLTDLTPDRKEKSDDTWGQIVRTLHSLQFSGDSFWRLDGPNQGKKSGRTLVKTEAEPQGGLKRSWMTVTDGKPFTFAVLNIEDEYQTPEVPSRFLEIECSEKIQCNVQSTRLRPYATSLREFKGSTSDYWNGDMGSVHFKTTGLEETDFPIGPNFELPIRVHRRRVMTVIGVISIAISAILYILCTKLSIYSGTPKKIDIDATIALLVITAFATGFALLGTYLLRREFSTK
jgi:hypothetical protein